MAFLGEGPRQTSLRPTEAESGSLSLGCKESGRPRIPESDLDSACGFSGADTPPPPYPPGEAAKHITASCVFEPSPSFTASVSKALLVSSWEACFLNLPNGQSLATQRLGGPHVTWCSLNAIENVLVLGSVRGSHETSCAAGRDNASTILYKTLSTWFCPSAGLARSRFSPNREAGDS